MPTIEQDVNTLEQLMELLKKKDPKLEIELNKRDFGEYYPSATTLLLSGWDNGAGYCEITVQRKYHPINGYGDMIGLVVEFLEGDSEDEDYKNNPDKIRRQWYDEYVRNFIKKFGLKVKITFKMNDTLFGKEI